MTLNLYNNAKIKFADGEEVKQADEAVYLGVELNTKVDIKKEINKRYKEVIISWKRLGEFWKHGNSSTKDKLIIFNALIKSKLMYGLEGAQLNFNHLQKLNTMQLKGLRQILNITTTYIDRTHTNEFVFNQGQAQMKAGKTLKSFSESYQEKRMKYMGHLLRQTDDAPEKFATLHTHTPFPQINPIRRVGAPRINWAEETMKMAWKTIYEQMEENQQEMDISNSLHINTLALAAHIYLI